MYRRSGNVLGICYLDSEGNSKFVIQVKNRVHVLNQKAVERLHEALLDARDSEELCETIFEFEDSMSEDVFKISVGPIVVKFAQKSVSFNDMLHLVYAIQHASFGEIICAEECGVESGVKRLVVGDAHETYLITASKSGKITLLAQGATNSWVDIQRGAEAMQAIVELNNLGEQEPLAVAEVRAF